ncbi:MAG TPA: penicillin-binding protein 2 [Candidatus Limnocylindrales bacterium]|nr:penicillin-binding protein 2 [Candidatus Limnocylindrales bacterium]
MADLNDGRVDLHRSRGRFIAFAVAAVILLVALGGRLFQLQVVSGDVYADRAAADRTVEVPIPAPRGLIFDRTGRPVAVSIPSWTVRVRPADLSAADRSRVIRRVAELTGADRAVLRARLDAFSGSPFDLVPVQRGVTREAALLIGEEAEDLPGVFIAVEPIRQYLDETGEAGGGLLSHVVGYTGPIDREELLALEVDGYLRDDVIGKAGVEASFEDALRGTYGSQLVERDASGRQLKVIETIREPIAGTNLMLTIDADVQRLATQALTWGMDVADVSQGVTVVMNPQTGEILAMVSLPAYDNNKFADGISTDDYDVYLADPDRPLRNHAISDIYPPGSTYKLVTGIAALEEGVTTPDRLWPTYGCYQIPGAPRGECLYDWNRQGFGPLAMVDAFAKSSDTFFYQMAVETGIDPLAEWANELGFGRLSGVRLPSEEEGIIASTEWARQQGRSGVFTGELAQAGIGQNVIAVTPIQILNAYAAVANGGSLMRPMIVRGETDASGELVEAYEPEVIHEIAADEATLRTMRVGAREVITSGHAYNIRDLKLPGALSGKTGTAEFGELTEEGTLPFHSWFVAYLPSAAGATDAELAIVSFNYSAVVPGNVSAEVVKYFLQLYYELDVDLRLDPNDFSLVTAN